jgi:hypothetical protein
MASSLQDQRVWLGGGALAAVVIAAASWFLLIHPELSAANDLHNQADGQRTQNQQLANKVESLKHKSEHLSRYTTALGRALDALPFDSGLPALTRQLSSEAAANGVEVSSISVGSIKATTSQTPVSTSSDENSSTDATSTTGPSVPTSGIVVGNTYAIPVSLISVAPLRQQEAFLEAIRADGPRHALVTNVQLAPGAGARIDSIDSSSAMTTQFTVYAAPQTPDELGQLRKLLSGDIGN